ncbi:hypothetical protein NVV93_00190 [Pseudomonas sp. LS44]|uniref:PA0061/PA0062 family lipoprotein n=1 Tax=Pseudomonas sp. LS44 TaxID=1357074 RepID=UPI00215A51C9|nr:hypothetical protein [Pseudomonas sp. LS44]UVE17856.1 hypothetical protein NVV93_00190 [Pseudomonas sp. LS44]
MRALLLPLVALSLYACAGSLPPADPHQAWVELATQQPSHTISANRLDGARLSEGRFFQVNPGAHELEVRFQYERSGGGGMDPSGSPGQVACILRVQYASFAAGQRYRLEARPLAAKAQAWLYDGQRKVLARGEVLRCGPF